MSADNTQRADDPPLRRCWTRDELQAAVKAWMRENADAYTREQYHASLGLLVDFVTDLFDGVNVQPVQPKDTNPPTKKGRQW